MFGNLKSHLREELKGIREAGLYKGERIIESPQDSRIKVGNALTLNFCANNYLGLADHPEVVKAAAQALEEWGFGLASVRFICGTQGLHKVLERKLSEFLRREDTILFSSCWDANGGVFETLLGPEDAVFSDELNHASIIDGIRLCKAGRFRYRHSDLRDLEAKLRESEGARFRLIVTDGVFSMDGDLADLPGICDLADRYEALVMVDDSHAVGFIGEGGRGTPEHFGVEERVDILTGTLGKALGGASGGYVSAPKEMVEILRQRARPYLFSNTVAPPVAAGSLKALELIESQPELRQKLERNAKRFREGLSELGFHLVPGGHPIIPVMLGDAALAGRFAEALLEEGIYVIGFSYPVVPKGKARIRTQVSAAHSEEDLAQALAAFGKVRDRLGVGAVA